MPDYRKFRSTNLIVGNSYIVADVRPDLERKPERFKIKYVVHNTTQKNHSASKMMFGDLRTSQR
jgi:hypothetical protein